MILRPYKLLVIAEVQRRWYTSECRSVCGSGSEHLGEARTAHSMGVIASPRILSPVTGTATGKNMEGAYGTFAPTVYYVKQF